MNVLIIMSDEHSNSVMGCTGHSIVKTPNLDRLALKGVMFDNCYTTCPLCVPARASFFTSKYVNRLGTWDNVAPYDGRIMGMSQYLSKYGYKIYSIGKLDFHPQGIYEGLFISVPKQRVKPQYESCFRDTDIHSPHGRGRFGAMGIRDENNFDDFVLNKALEFIKSKQKGDEPWVMYVGFTSPHFPFYVRRKNWEYYDKMVKSVPDIAQPPFEELNKPLKKLRAFFDGDRADLEIIRKAQVGYYALTTELDANVGSLLDALEEQGLEEETLVIYTSDHGEQLGHHGLWWKCCMYENSIHIPLIMKGPGIESGRRIDGPVSLVDIFPTVCEALGLPKPDDIDGQSLYQLACGGGSYRRDFVFSEYHGHGVESAIYMIRWDKWKYVYYVNFKPQLFNLEEDENEMNDLLKDGVLNDEIRLVLRECESRLKSVCDPEKEDGRAKKFQKSIRLQLELAGYDQNNFNFESLPEIPRPIAVQSKFKPE